VHKGRPITTALLCDLNALLMTGMPLASVSGRLRDKQVVIGQRADADRAGFPIHAARFLPAPPGSTLALGLQDLVEWLRTDHASRIDPVVASAMVHYQYETLHPFHDGNGRIGRLLVVLHLQQLKVLSEPTLTVSPWFEARRAAYYDRLLAVSTNGNWDAFVGFFAQGLEAAAQLTRQADDRADGRAGGSQGRRQGLSAAGDSARTHLST
jgi:Fic family protein